MIQFGARGGSAQAQDQNMKNLQPCCVKEEAMHGPKLRAP